MRSFSFHTLSSSLLAAASLASALPAVPLDEAADAPAHLQSSKRQEEAYPNLPAEITDYKTITTDRGVTIRYRQPGKDGLCETTPDVNSYSGYIDVDEDNHIFFYYFESRRDPANDDLTLWMNGGPGSDSLLGLFDELGPCRINQNLSTTLNPWSFSNVSNLLFLSPPVGVGYSYQDTMVGTMGYLTNIVQPPEKTPKNSTIPFGRYSTLKDNEDTIDTTDKAAIAGFEIIQGFIAGMEDFEGAKSKKPKKFDLWAESYGGHWGPAFMNQFAKQNEAIASGAIDAHPMELGTLGMINPFVDAKLQDPWGPEFAINNNYGITALNESQYIYTQQAMWGPMGCRDQIDFCIEVAKGIEGGFVDGFITNVTAADTGANAVCSKAMGMCRDNVELVYNWYSGRGVYDIRHPSLDPTPPMHLPAFLNQAEIQRILGVSVNYTATTSKSEIFNAFTQTGDWVWPNSLRHIEQLLSKGIRITLLYGDADYVTNWHGGEFLSKAIPHEGAVQFAAAGYQPLEYAGETYGDVREYGNLSFVRVFDAGHLVPYYQPQAAFALFNRTIHGRVLADGLLPISDDYSTSGPANSTHTQTAEPLPPVDLLAPEESEDYLAYAAALIEEYDAKFQVPPNGSHY